MALPVFGWVNPKDLACNAWRGNKLKQFCKLKEGTLEDIEKLEQLRVLDNGKQIAITEVTTISFGIDTYEDLEKAISFLHKS